MFDYKFKAADGATRTIPAPNLSAAELLVMREGFKPRVLTGCSRSSTTLAEFNRQHDNS